MKRQDLRKSLLIGIGNSAREDDGLGWEFVEIIEKENIFNGDCLYRFQLNIEDIILISQYEQIIFVDASKNEIGDGFNLSSCRPGLIDEFSTHIIHPESILYFCKELYKTEPKAWMIAIQGYKWEIKEGISIEAEENLLKAIEGFKQFLIKNQKFIF